jgi:hypothetical protein
MLFDIGQLTSFFDTFVILSVTTKKLLIYGTIFNLSLIASITQEIEKSLVRMGAFFCLLLAPFMFSVLSEGVNARSVNDQPLIIELAADVISGPAYVGVIASLGFVLSLLPLLAMFWKKLWLSIGKASVTRGRSLSALSSRQQSSNRKSGRGIFRD